MAAATTKNNDVPDLLFLVCQHGCQGCAELSLVPPQTKTDPKPRRKQIQVQASQDSKLVSPHLIYRPAAHSPDRLHSPATRIDMLIAHRIDEHRQRRSGRLCVISSSVSDTLNLKSSRN